MFIGDRGRRAAVLKVSWFDGNWAEFPSIYYLDKKIPSDERVEKQVNATLKKAERECLE